MVQRTVRLLVILAAAFLTLALSAKADDIVFSGDQLASSPDVVLIVQGADHAFSLEDAPLDSLTINGTSVASFSGDLSISGVTGDTTDSSGDLLFNGGTLTISSGSTPLVTAQLLGSALLISSCTDDFCGFLAVLDPNNTTFGGLLASEPPLAEGLGETVQILIPAQIVDGAVIFGGQELDAEVGLVTPEPSTLALLGLGVLGLWIASRRRFRFGFAAH